MRIHILTMLAFCISATANAGEVFRVEQKGMKFSPSSLSIESGSQITFLNNDKVRHWVASNSSSYPLDSGDMGPNDSKTLTVNKPGVVELRCNYHPDMKMTVVVQLQRNR